MMKVKVSIIFSIIFLLLTSFTASACQIMNSKNINFNETTINSIMSALDSQNAKLFYGLNSDNQDTILAAKKKSKKENKKKSTKPIQPEPQSEPQPLKEKIHIAASPLTKTVTHPSDFSIAINASLKNGNIAAYGLIIDFNPQIISLNTSLGQSGTEKGAKGFLTAAKYSDNQLRISGFDVNGVGPGNNIELVKINFKTRNTGSSKIIINVDSLSDLSATSLSNSVSNGTVIVTSKEDQGAKQNPSTPVKPKATPKKTSINKIEGSVWLEPADTVLEMGSIAKQTVQVNTGNKKIAAYGLFISFDPKVINVDTSKGSNGVEAGADGFIAAINADNTNGILRCSGFDTSGKGPGILDLLIVNWKTVGKGTTTLGIEIGSFADSTTSTIGNTAYDGFCIVK